jgi:hypothetical protein
MYSFICAAFGRLFLLHQPLLGWMAYWHRQDTNKAFSVLSSSLLHNGDEELGGFFLLVF